MPLQNNFEQQVIKPEMELVVFDFDNTIIGNNADTFINRLAPDRKIPDSIKSIYNGNSWTAYMREVFKYLHENGVTQTDYLHCLEEIELLSGFKSMLKKLEENDRFHVIIISDANTIFIEHILKTAGLRVKELFTNPARFDSDDCLKLSEYHIQDWCTLCSKNLCKGQILENYIEKQKRNGIEYGRVSYVGDGSNDFCPTLRLTKNDLVFPRKNFRLMEKIQGQLPNIKAKVCPWDNGYEVMNILNI